MKRLTIFLFLLVGSQGIIFSQLNTDFGLLLGGSYYMGDINPTKHFYSLSPAYGALVRYNINNRYAIRLSGMYAVIKGSDDDFDRVNADRVNTTFSTELFDFDLRLEFNFLPYITGEDKWINSIYLSGGAGYSQFLNLSGQFTIPFGIGFKLNVTDRLSTGLEWSFRKTFTDKIDTVENPLGHSLINNNDWYSFAGIFITYKFVKFAADCPVYD